MQKYESIEEINRERHEQYLNVQREAEELFVKNHKEYENDITIYGAVGVLVRITDKIKRLVSITKTGVNLKDEEIIRDTLIDIQNLSTYCTILLDEDETMKDHYTGKMRNMLIKSAEKPNRTLTESFMNTVDELKGKIDKTVKISKLYRSKSTINLLNLKKKPQTKENDKDVVEIEGTEI